jgi:LacI family transcriptional regulator
MATSANSRPKKICVIASFARYISALNGVTAFARVARHGHLVVDRFSDTNIMSWLNGSHLDGIVACGLRPDALKAVCASPIPVVSAIASPPRPEIPSVLVDDVAVGQMAADYLVGCGYRHFAYVGTDRRWSCDRFEGFQAQLAKRKLSCVSNCVNNRWPVWISDASDAELRRFLLSLKPPTAILACSDAIARATVEAIQSLGLRIPEQLAVLGVDDNDWECECGEITISSIDCNIERVGYESARMLQQLMTGRKPVPAHILIPPAKVVQRRSTDSAAFDDPEMATAVRIIREQACDGLTVDKLCAQLAVSRRTLECRYLKATGRSPGGEIHRIRMDRAKELLTVTDLSFLDVAMRCGYEHYPSFCTAFRRTVGTTPRDFRTRGGILSSADSDDRRESSRRVQPEECLGHRR